MTKVDRGALEALVWKKFPAEGKVKPSSGVAFIKDGGKLRPLGAFTVSELFGVLRRVAAVNTALAAMEAA
jgi:hypothetical protein